MSGKPFFCHFRTNSPIRQDLSGRLWRVYRGVSRPARHPSPIACLPDTPCYVNLQEKKKTLPLSGTSHRLLYFPLCTEPSLRTSHQCVQASRLTYLLFEVAAVATPQVAYAFVTKRLPALHTFARAGSRAGTRGETKSQSSRGSCLSEKTSIRVGRFRNPSSPYRCMGLMAVWSRFL
jgi:hypothetical protein